MERGVNLHHVIWMRRDYKTSLEKRFRNSLVIPMPIAIHADLHHNLYPPPKPERDVMFGILDVVETNLSPVENLHTTIEYLGSLETRATDRLANHLTRQLGYIAL